MGHFELPPISKKEKRCRRLFEVLLLPLPTGGEKSQKCHLGVQSKQDNKKMNITGVGVGVVVAVKLSM